MTLACSLAECEASANPRSIARGSSGGGRLAGNKRPECDLGPVWREGRQQDFLSHHPEAVPPIFLGGIHGLVRASDELLARGTLAGCKTGKSDAQ